MSANRNSSGRRWATAGAVLAAFVLAVYLWTPPQSTREGLATSGENVEEPGSSTVSGVDHSRVAVQPTPVAEGQESPTSSGQSDSTVEFLVVDLEDRPIPGAQVLSWNGSSETVHGVTDESGRTAISTDSVRERRATVRSTGYCSVTQFIPIEPPSSIRIRLAVAAGIAGSVLDAASGDPIADADVVAWPLGLLPMSGTESLGALLGDPAFASTRTHTDGSFVLPGLDPGVRYGVCAGAPGRASRGQYAVGTPGGKHVVVELERVLGVVFRYRDAEGGPVVVADELLPRLSQILLPRNARPITGAFQSVLAGQVEIPDGADRVYLYVTNDGSDRIGPLEFDVDLPGYLPTRVSAFAEPCDPDIPVALVELQRDAPAFGYLDIEYSGLPDRGPRWGNSTGKLARTLTLENLDTGELDTLRLPTASNEPTRIGPIPFGRYHASARFAAGHSWPWDSGQPHLVEVNSERTPLRIEMQDAGTLELLPTVGDGEPSLGILEVRLYTGYEIGDGGRESWKARSGPWLFLTPPYVIGGIRPGTYYLRLDQPLRGRPEEIRTDEIVITGGRVTTLAPELPLGSWR